MRWKGLIEEYKEYLSSVFKLVRRGNGLKDPLTVIERKEIKPVLLPNQVKVSAHIRGVVYQ